MMRKSRCNGSSESSSKREGRTVSRNTGLAEQGLAVSLNKLYSFAEPSPTKWSNTEKIIFPFCQQAVMVCHQCIYIFREGYSCLCWEPSSLWVFMHEDQRVSVLLPDRFANKLKKKGLTTWMTFFHSLASSGHLLCEVPRTALMWQDVHSCAIKTSTHILGTLYLYIFIYIYYN